jgi:DNA primase small subunit
VTNNWTNSGSSLEKWTFLERLVSRKIKDIPVDPTVLIPIAVMYPRIDVNVSVNMSHLLKCPFCVHPATGLHLSKTILRLNLVTGKVCVPIPRADFETFSPCDAMTYIDAIKEVEIKTILGAVFIG